MLLPCHSICIVILQFRYYCNIITIARHSNSINFHHGISEGLTLSTQKLGERFFFKYTNYLIVHLNFSFGLYFYFSKRKNRIHQFSRIFPFLFLPVTILRCAKYFFFPTSPQPLTSIGYMGYTATSKKNVSVGLL